MMSTTKAWSKIFCLQHMPFRKETPNFVYNKLGDTFSRLRVAIRPPRRYNSLTLCEQAVIIVELYRKYRVHSILCRYVNIISLQKAIALLIFEIFFIKSVLLEII